MHGLVLRLAFILLVFCSFDARMALPRYVLVSLSTAVHTLWGEEWACRRCVCMAALGVFDDFEPMTNSSHSDGEQSDATRLHAAHTVIFVARVFIGPASYGDRYI